MVDAKKMWSDLNKIPIIGDFIISFGIVVVLISFSSEASFFGAKASDSKVFQNVCFAYKKRHLLG